MNAPRTLRVHGVVKDTRNGQDQKIFILFISRIHPFKISSHLTSFKIIKYWNMNSTNCTDHQTLYALQILLEWGTAPYLFGESKQPIDGYRDENFRWKVEDTDGSIIYGSNQYKLYESPKNETFCLDTYSCYEISIEKQYSYMSEAGVKLFAGDELLAEMGGDKNHILYFKKYTCPIPTISPTDPPYYNFNNYEQPTDPSENITLLIAIAATMLIIILFLYLTYRQAAQRQHDDQRQESTHDQNNGNDLTEEGKHDRKLKILNSIITKVR